jgi:hypothetical protein
MTALRTLLLAALVPLVTLPDGITVCLKLLFVGAPPAEAGADCCAGRSPRGGERDVDDDSCRGCCVTVPATERSIDPAAKKAEEEAGAPAPASATPAALHDFGLARGPAAWSHHDPPPSSLVPISLPLRL